MADENRNPLELDAVVRRFSKSAEALENVRGQLQVLAKLYDAEERVNASLEEASGQVARFVAEAAAILRGLEDAQTRVIEVLKSGSALLDGTELKGISESVKANSQAISTIVGGVNALESKVSEMPDKVSVEIKRVAESVEANALAISRVGDRVNALTSTVWKLPDEVGAEIKRVVESVEANAKAISGVYGRVEALESKVERDMAELKEKMGMVYAAAKTPLIKRLF